MHRFWRAAIEVGVIAIYVGSSCAVVSFINPILGIVLCTSALLVHLLLAAVHASERGKLSHCVACGQDLRGNVSGACPECGTAVPETDSTDVS